MLHSRARQIPIPQSGKASPPFETASDAKRYPVLLEKMIPWSKRLVFPSQNNTYALFVPNIEDWGPEQSQHLQMKQRNAIYPAEYEGHLKQLLLPRDDLQSRAQDLAKNVHKDYKNKRLFLLCVLKGAAPFFSHLCEALANLGQGFLIDFIRVSSYDGTNTTGSIQVGGGVNFNQMVNRDVIVVEDIIDTGTTLSNLLPILEKKGRPTSIEVCTLLTKRLGIPSKVTAKYVGFSIPPQFIIGYGLDYNELYRDLQDIWIISEQGIKDGA